jgi:tRNA A-37 threonylcarbamoyl transferase component Bud32
MAADEAPALSLPHRLEGTSYELQQLLGAGAMGAVYLAESLELRRLEVVKVLHAKHSNRAEIIGRFRQEARLVSQLSHPALPVVYALGQAAGGQHWIAMERLQGEDVRTHIRRRGRLPWREAAELVAQALDGLGVAHAAGILHRDVKPENLFRTSDGRIKVLDFGIAKPLEEQRGTDVNTAFGMVLGTPRYMSPEQAKGNPLGPQTDIYAMGCVLFEMVTGAPMAQGSSAQELLRWHVHGVAPSLASRTNETFPTDVEAVVARSLAKEPAARFPSAAEMAGALRAMLGAPERSIAAAHVFAPVGGSIGERPTVRVDSVPPLAALPTGQAGRFTTERDGGASVATQPVSAPALLAGVATTEQGPANRTAPTEVLGEAGRLGTGTLAMEVPPVTAISQPAPIVLPPGVIDYSLNTDSLARELSASRTTAASKRISPLRRAANVIGVLGVLALAGLGVASIFRDRPTAAKVDAANGSQEARPNGAAGAALSAVDEPKPEASKSAPKELRAAGEAERAPTMASASAAAPDAPSATVSRSSSARALNAPSASVPVATVAGGIPSAAWLPPKPLVAADGRPIESPKTPAIPASSGAGAPPASTTREKLKREGEGRE